MNIPLVTFCMPAMNHATIIKAAIQSILTQTEPNIELIISDNLSTDGTSEICASFAKQDSRVKHYRQEDPPMLENWMLSQVRSPYYVMAHDDDIHDPNYARVLIGLLESHPNAVLAMCAHDEIKGSLVVPGAIRVIDNNRSTFDSLCNYIHSDDYVVQFGVYRTDALRKAGGFYCKYLYPSLRYHDYITPMRTLFYGSVVYTDRVLFHKYDSGFYLTKYQVLRELKLDRKMRYRIVRFLTFPRFFFGGLIESLSCISKSVFTWRQKACLRRLTFVWYVKRHFFWMGEICRGGWCVLRGVCSSVFLRGERDGKS